MRERIKVMKEVIHALRLKLPAKKATIAPPVGTILGPSNINLNKFCDDFNNWSKELEGEIELGVLVYDDLSYDILSKEEFNHYEATQLYNSLGFLYHDQEENMLRKR